MFFLSCSDFSPTVYIPEFPGCMDELACNYDPEATLDNNSCYYSLDSLAEVIDSNDALGGCFLPDNTLYLSSNGDVLYRSNEDIAGFQFNVDGATVLNGSDGDSQENGFIITTNDNIVVGVDFSGGVIPSSCSWDNVQGCSLIIDQCNGLEETVCIENEECEWTLNQSCSAIDNQCDQLEEIECLENQGCGILVSLDITDQEEEVKLSDIVVSNVEGDEIDFKYLQGCDCEGLLLSDCAGECGGESVEDCSGECGGNFIPDTCGVCDDDPSNDGATCLDCSGVPNGTYEESECLGCVDYPFYTYDCNDISALQDIIDSDISFYGLMPYELGNSEQYWNEEGRLESLDLSYYELSSLPESIGDLDGLVFLDLQGNELTDLPSSIGDLNNLETLWLHYNSLITLPDDIGDLENLINLDLHWNNLEAIPNDIGDLFNLEYLDLQSNQLTTLPDEITDLENLTHLDVGQNQISELPSDIGDLANLTDLYIGNNSTFLSSLPESISGLESLVTLKMNNNSIVELPENIHHLTNLRNLNCRSNLIEDLPSTLCDLHENCTIDLYGNLLCPNIFLQYSCIDNNDGQTCDDE